MAISCICNKVYESDKAGIGKAGMNCQENAFIFAVCEITQELIVSEVWNLESKCKLGGAQ